MGQMGPSLQGKAGNQMGGGLLSGFGQQGMMSPDMSGLWNENAMPAQPQMTAPISPGYDFGMNGLNSYNGWGGN